MEVTVRNRFDIFFNKLTRFEFWPYWFFYIPMYIYGLKLALKARSFMYFSNVNPSMQYGGVMGVSKYEVLSSIPMQYIPKTVFISTNADKAAVEEAMVSNGLQYPVILKPDVGERGKDVELIDNAADLEGYLSDKSEDLILQEFIDYPIELGIMYHRFPGEKKGFVTSITQKSFLTLSGNGRDDIQTLLSTELRASGRIEYLSSKLKDKLGEVIPEGQEMLLEPIGNHCRGTSFLNANHLINDKLSAVFDRIALQIPGYFYGRFDLKVRSMEDLYKGENIRILELNGVSSEVTHVYDPGYKLWKAYRDIARHMDLIYKISKINRENGISFSPLRPFLQDLRIHLKRRKRGT